MATLPTERPVTPLRLRMLDDMAMRAMGARTQHDCVRHVRAFAAFLKRSPDTATPMAKAPHPAYALATDITGKQRPVPVPPQPYPLVADVDPALKQQILDVPQTQRKPYIITTSRINLGDEFK